MRKKVKLFFFCELQHPELPGHVLRIGENESTKLNQKKSESMKAENSSMLTSKHFFHIFDALQLSFFKIQVENS